MERRAIAPTVLERVAPRPDPALPRPKELARVVPPAAVEIIVCAVAAPASRVVCLARKMPWPLLLLVLQLPSVSS